MGIEHKHQHEHEHGHHQEPSRRKLQHDWRVWLVVGLMLTSMLVYVMSDNERFGWGGSQRHPPVPAMAP